MRSFVGLWVVLLTLCASPASAWEDRKEYSLYAVDAEGNPATEVMVFEEFAFIGSPDVSADATKVAMDGWKVGQELSAAHLLIADLQTGEMQDLGPGAMPTWSPDGGMIACSRYGSGIWIVSVDGKQGKQIDGRGWGGQWSPDGRKLAYTIGGQVVIYDILTEAKKEVFPTNALPYQYLYWNGTWSPDSKQLCFKAQKGENQNELIIVTVDGDKPDVRVVGNANDLLEDIAWHPDGTRIVVPNHQGKLMVFRPDGSEPPQQLKGQPADRANAGVSWTRDGKVLLLISVK